MLMSIYLFVLCPPFSGSTVLWELLKTSPNVSDLSKEGQFVKEVKDIMRDSPWDWKNQKKYPWDFIKKVWTENWDQSKPILLEKSPPNLIRAFEIEQIFDPCYFIATIRNPYAFCEGFNRRFNFNVKNLGATFWVKCAEFQKKNIQGLSNVIKFSYEEFTEDTVEIKNNLLNFLPQLETLDIDTDFEVTSIEGKVSRKITNLNQVKINKLSSKDISKINRILFNHPDIMDFFGYHYI